MQILLNADTIKTLGHFEVILAVDSIHKQSAIAKTIHISKVAISNSRLYFRQFLYLYVERP
tara:strand:- start:700 stop:882 length:183 start_codon:yes stop_codon:yes gene_type:complete